MRRYGFGKVIFLVGALFLLFNILFLHDRNSFASLPLRPFWAMEHPSSFFSYRNGTLQLLPQPIVPHRQPDSLFVETLTRYKRARFLIETSA